MQIRDTRNLQAHFMDFVVNFVAKQKLIQNVSKIGGECNLLLIKLVSNIEVESYIFLIKMYQKLELDVIYIFGYIPIADQNVSKIGGECNLLLIKHWS